MADRLLLVVEGKNDQHVIYALLQHHSFKPEFTVQPEGSVEILLERLSIRLIPGSDLERLGIVVDADNDLESRWRSLKGILTRAGLATPDRPDPSGTVIDHEILPRVGVWLMPNNALPGMLEDYVGLLIPAGEAERERVARALWSGRGALWMRSRPRSGVSPLVTDRRP